MTTKAPGRLFEFGPFRLDIANWQLTRDDQPIALEPQVFKLLLLLLERRGNLLTKTELVEQLWPDSHVEERTLTQHVYVLRKALEPHGHQYIQNVPKKGYRFAGEVTIREPAGEPATSTALPSPVPTPVTRRWRLSWLAALPIAAAVMWTLDRAAPEPTPAVGARLQRLTEHGTAQLAALAPDGNRVAYTRSGPRGEALQVITADASEDSELIAAGGDRYQGITFAPGGEWLYYVRDFRLFRLRLSNRAGEELLRGVDRPISFSPDGRHFAYIRDDVSRAESSIHIAAADGSSSRPLAVRKKPMFYRAVAWSPKENVIAAAGGYEGHEQMGLVVIDVASASERPLGKPWPHVGEIGWYPDGTALAAIIRPERAKPRQIVQVAYPSGVDTGVTSDLDDYRSLSISPQGVIASIQAALQSNLWMITAGSAPRALTSGASDDRYPAWVNDDTIVYQRNSGGRGQIYRMELSAGTTRPLTPVHCDSSAPTVTPDGQWIVFVSACAGPATLWRMRADGTELRQLTAGAGDNHPSVSADGAWVYYESLDAEGKPIVKRVPLAGGRAKTVTTRLSRTPVASPNGDVIACYYWDEHSESPVSIALVSSTGALVGSLPALSPARRWPFMRWSVDGTFLVTVGRDGDPQNLWGYPIDGGPPRAFSEFSDALETFAFAWARDPGRMIVARGHARDDVVLVR